LRIGAIITEKGALLKLYFQPLMSFLVTHLIFRPMVWFWNCRYDLGVMLPKSRLKRLEKLFIVTKETILTKHIQYQLQPNLCILWWLKYTSSNSDTLPVKNQKFVPGTISEIPRWVQGVDNESFSYICQQTIDFRHFFTSRSKTIMLCFLCVIVGKKNPMHHPRQTRRNDKNASYWSRIRNMLGLIQSSRCYESKEPPFCYECICIIISFY
jgi:hypothetical protein